MSNNKLTAADNTRHFGSKKLASRSFVPTHPSAARTILPPWRSEQPHVWYIQKCGKLLL